MSADSSSTDRPKQQQHLFDGIAVTRPRKYLRHYQYVIYRADLPAVKVTILNKDYARLQCKGYEKYIEMTDEIQPPIRVGRMGTNNELDADTTTIPEVEYLFDGIVITKPRKYTRHLQYVIRRENLPTVKVTVLNRNLARLRCKGYEKIVRMINYVN